MNKKSYSSYIGEKFGRIIITDIFKKDNRFYFNYTCDCSNKASARCDSIIGNKIISCGCAKIERLLDYAKKKFENYEQASEASAQIHLFKRYKRDAIKRGRMLLIEFDLFINITSSNCEYCSIKPNQMHAPSGKRYSTYIYNGIDRKDNLKDYTEDNIVPCCVTCNVAKSKWFTHEELKLIMDKRLKENPEKDPWGDLRLFTIGKKLK